MRRWALPVVIGLAIVTLALVSGPPAQGIVLSGFFTDDNGSTFEADIDAIAAVGITKGCNPPANTRFCPNDDVTRGQMAAFLKRALHVPNSPADQFIDDNTSTFEADINAIAAVGITKGCNPPANTRFCPNDDVTRGQMAAFLRRALELPYIVQTIPMGAHSSLSCSKDGQRCSMTVDLSAGQTYRVREGIYQVNPASSSEQSSFNASGTNFALTADGAGKSLAELAKQTGGGVTSRRWQTTISFTPGNHTLVGRWRWGGNVIQTNTITIRASG